MSAAGYSGTQLPRKLGIRDGSRVLLVHAPTGFAAALGELPEGARIVDAGEGLDVVVVFVSELADLRAQFAGLAASIDPAGGVWVAWPKRASGIATDVNENRVREIGLEAGLVDNKVCAIDTIWSGLRFVVRLRDRPRGPGRRRGLSG
jgi:hypothetical protein